MSLTLTPKQYRLAAALCADDGAIYSQGQIAEQIGVNRYDFSTTIKKVSVKMGLVGANETGQVSRTRLLMAARKAGGFDKLAASLGLLNRDRETVQ